MAAQPAIMKVVATTHVSSKDFHGKSASESEILQAALAAIRTLAGIRDKRQALSAPPADV